MIGFFRKIRKKLADDNQFFKYSRYAIGEIVLVVVGILIALQINNWNNDRLKKEQLNTFLVRLTEDLQSDRLNLNRKVTGYQKGALRHNHVLKICGLDTVIIEELYRPEKETEIYDWQWQGPYPEEFDFKFFKNVIIITGHVLRFNSKNSTITEMKNTGIYSEIKNVTLKDELDTYYNEIVEFDANQIDLAKNWIQTMIDDGVYPDNDMDRMDDPKELITKSPKRISLLKYLIREYSWKHYYSGRLAQRIDSMIPKLEAEINW
ncbi:DUF6090 family protein [Eudoraea adriatica]|uniref:DUF6090 family protein n=1 Tax=Eudoraea adriatica TaxID=446681 RepID=UPI00035ECA1F|nr:DUF6090 family protein [Eudoraea adriatica]